jgi:hypothetical protein
MNGTKQIMYVGKFVQEFQTQMEIMIQQILNNVLALMQLMNGMLQKGSV